MGQKKKIKKPKILSKDHVLKIELEENADELFLEAIENIDINGLGDVVAPEDSAFGAERKETPVVRFEIDLHGKTLQEAKIFLTESIDRYLDHYPNQKAKIKIITGKGLHSSDRGGVLPREIHRYVGLRYKGSLKSIQESPDDVRINGIPIRGYFIVEF